MSIVVSSVDFSTVPRNNRAAVPPSNLDLSSIDETAARHGASVDVETDDPARADVAPVLEPAVSRPVPPRGRRPAQAQDAAELMEIDYEERPGVFDPIAAPVATIIKAGGEYDIVLLSAKESDGLETWLTENGYNPDKALTQGAIAGLCGGVNAAADSLVFRIIGQPGHGAYPHATVLATAANGAACGRGRCPRRERPRRTRTSRASSS